MLHKFKIKYTIIPANTAIVFSHTVTMLPSLSKVYEWVYKNSDDNKITIRIKAAIFTIKAAFLSFED